MSRFFLKLFFLSLLLSTPNAHAEDKNRPIFYTCETTQNVISLNHELTIYKPSRFSIAISNNELFFYEADFYGVDFSLNLSKFNSASSWEADYDRWYVSFSSGDFYYVSVFGNASKAVSAKCQKSG